MTAGLVVLVGALIIWLGEMGDEPADERLIVGEGYERSGDGQPMLRGRGDGAVEKGTSATTPRRNVRRPRSGSVDVSENLLVSVQDSMGRPAEGVQVVLEIRRKPGSPKFELVSSKWTAVAGALSDAHGQASIDIAKVQSYRVLRKSNNVQAQYCVRAEVASSRTAAVELDGTPEDGQRVELKLPALGSLRVNVIDNEGATPGIPTCVALNWDTWESGVVRPRCHPDNPRMVKNGIVDYKSLELGLSLRVTASAYDDSVGSASTIVRGPTRSGERTSVTLRLGPSRPRIRGTLLNPDGVRIPKSRFTYQAWLPDELFPGRPDLRGRLSSIQHFRTDEEGRFDFAFGSTIPTVGDQRAIIRVKRIHTLDQAIEGTDHTILYSRLELPRQLPSAPWDLGNVTLEPVPLLVAGTVVDDQEQPVRGATVVIQSGSQNRQRMKWDSIPGLNWRTKRNGRFRFQHAGKVETGSILITARGYEPLRFQDFRRGDAGVVVHLKKSAK